MSERDNPTSIVHRKNEDYRSGYAKMFWQRQTLSACLVISLIIALAACSTGSTSPQVVKSPATSVHLTPTPTSLPHGTLLYQSDWSHGLAGWHGSAGWKLTHGWLQSDL